MLSNTRAASSSRNDRNYGIDGLRILSMLMIPTLHILLRGGILNTAVSFSAQYDIAWLLEAFSVGAVNCYALISGYVGYRRKIKYANLMYLYLNVIFYTIPITILWLFIDRNMVGKKTMVQAIFPFAYSRDTYWYFAAYLCMFFFIPLFNYILQSLNRSSLRRLMVAFIIIFSVFPTVFHSDMGMTDKGYSALWISILYMLGGYIKKYGIDKALRKSICIIGYILCTLVTWASRLMIELITNRLFGEALLTDYLFQYTSPTVLFSAVFLLCFFSQLEIKPFLKKMIGFFAPVSFGVYLIHEEPLIRDALMTGAFKGYVQLNPVLFALAIMGTAFGIWLVCSLIDYCRLLLFKLFKIREFCDNLESFIRRKTSLLYHKLFQKISQ